MLPHNYFPIHAGDGFCAPPLPHVLRGVRRLQDASPQCPLWHHAAQWHPDKGAPMESSTAPKSAVDHFLHNAKDVKLDFTSASQPSAGAPFISDRDAASAPPLLASHSPQPSLVASPVIEPHRQRRPWKRRAPVNNHDAAPSTPLSASTTDQRW